MRFRQCCALAVGAMILATAGFVDEGQARRPVISIGIPVPTIVFSGPPELAVVPGTNIYVAPDVEGDILFYQGFWWRLFDGRWYRSRYYDRDWVYMNRGRVPRSFYGYRPGFRHHYREHQRLHYDDVHRSWDSRHHDGYSGDRRHEQGHPGGSHQQGHTGGSHQRGQSRDGHNRHEQQ